MKNLVFIILLFLFSLTTCNKQPSINDFADKPISLDKEKSLVALGQLWGFLKYHHPEVAKGSYDWDMELMKRVPQVMEAESETEWKKILTNWIDSLPTVNSNPDKKLPDWEIKLKPDYGELFNPEYFLPETIEKIAFILNNTMITDNYYVKVDALNGKTTFTNEDSYKEILYPDLSYRLLALFKHWNTVNYFFPYRELCDQEWATVLPEMLPEFVYADNLEDYILACEKLTAKINDSHGYVRANNGVYALTKGILTVPFAVRFIENELVVTLLAENASEVQEKIRVGDIITTINGESIKNIVKKMTPYIAASNQAALYRNIAANILRGNTTTVDISVKRDAQSFDLTIPRYSHNQIKIPDYSNPQPDSEGYRILDNNIGYVLPSSCRIEDRLAGIEKVLNDTRGLIIDYRCYPSDDIALQFLDHLDHADKMFLRATSTDVSFPGYFYITNPNNLPNTKRGHKDYYQNKVVVIVNEYTQSAAEDSVLGFQMTDNTTVIGSTTAGADGRITNFYLPGNITITMTGRGAYYPDGGNLQRNGVKIDEVVKPTISGIREGRDEVLERAIKIIEAN